MATDPNAITFFRADSYPITITITYKATSLPVNLSGCTLLLTVDSLKAPVGETTQIFQVPGIISDAENGVVYFTPSIANTTQTPKKYYYDIQITDATGNVRTIAKSTFTITMDITK